MVQLQLSSALDKGRKHQHSVVCLQRTALGLYVGTMQATEDGYMGHLLYPKHPLLPLPTGAGRLGFLHSTHDEAYEVLALHVAKAAWQGSLGFEPTCLDKCSRTTRDSFVAWLIDQICDSRASAVHSAPAESEERRAVSIRIRPAVAKERAEAIARDFMSSHTVPGSIQ